MHRPSTPIDRLGLSSELVEILLRTRPAGRLTAFRTLSDLNNYAATRGGAAAFLNFREITPRHVRELRTILTEHS